MGDCCRTCGLGILMSCMGCCYHNIGPIDGLAPRPITFTSLQPVLEWKAAPLDGTLYQIDAERLEALQSPFLNPLRQEQREKQKKQRLRKPRPGYFSPKFETKLARKSPAEQMTEELRGQPLRHDQKAARRRLRAAFNQDFIGPDLYIKIVPDLDLLLFDGTLSDRVTVSWSDLATMDGQVIKGRCVATPLTGSLLKVQVKLNKTLFYYASKHEILGTLLHEMTHAYFALQKGAIKGSCMNQKKADEDVGMVAGALVKRLRIQGLEEGQLIQ